MSAQTEPGLGRVGAWVLAFLVLLAVTPVSAAEPEALPSGGRALVKEVISGDTLVLADGRVVKLAGIQAPKMNAGLTRPFRWPVAEEARAALAVLTRGHSVTLHFGGLRQDRHDRVPAQLVRDDGVWLQGAMLDQGLARVYTAADLTALGGRLYGHESAARAARIGIWAHPFYAVRGHDGLGRDFDTFQVVEGRVLAVAITKGQIFLNFGPDWRTDFTIRVPRRGVRAFRQLFGDPALLQGRIVRVRGWVYRHNGPEIELTHPEQMEPPEPLPVSPPVSSSLPGTAAPAPVSP